MKTKKRVISILCTFIMLSCLVACGNSTPAIGNDVVSIEESTGTESSEAESTEVSTEIVESGSAETSKEDSTEVKAEDTEITETKPADEPTTTPAVPTSTPSPTSTPEPTEPPHVHDYAETVTRQATCAEAGEKQLVCQGCGDVKVEAIPATGEHNWVEETTILHHEALGHVSEVQVQVGTSAGYCTYACSACGAEFNSPSEKTEHCASFVPDPHGMASTIVYDHPGEPIYETQSQWVVDQPEWDEVVGTGTYTCSVCGATK